MNVVKNSKEGFWELWDVQNESIVLRLPIDKHPKRSEAIDELMHMLYLKYCCGFVLVNEILEHREDYSVILMPDWVDQAEGFINDNGNE